MKYLLLFLVPFLSFAQQTDKVDFIKCNATVFPDFETRTVNGIVSYDFKVIASIDTIRIDAKKMQFSEVTINGKMVNFKNNNKELLLFEGFKKGKNQLQFSYQATPKQTMYFTGIGEGQQIWTQGQGRYTSHWLPSFDDVNEKVVFNMTILLTEQLNSTSKFVAISNGVLTDKEQTLSWSKGKKYWMYKFRMYKPMSSYLVMIAIGKFEHQTETSQFGIPLENYYKPVDEAKYPFTYKGSKTIFDFLEKEIGVKYPWKTYRQVPVEDFLYAGMENTSSTIFDQDYVVDESGFNDRNYIYVNAHELAHQWFGDIVTAKSGKHHWLQEGFATYYGLLSEREIFGEDYFYNQLYNYSNRLKVAAKTDTIPILNEKASSLSFYQKGAWALHFIKESIGEKKFKKAVKNYLKKYQFKNVDTDEFLSEIRKVSDFDTDHFKKVWLEDYRYPANDINFLLTKNGSMRDLLKLQYERKSKLEDKYNMIKLILTSDAYYSLKIEAIYQIKNEPFEKVSELYDLAMKSNNIEVRRYIAQSMSVVSNLFKLNFETLLYDQSYETQGAAFMTLWKSFPDDRARYLEIANKWEGRNDKELRILYLTSYISLHSNDENNSKVIEYVNELLEYTTVKYQSSVRQNALEYVLDLVPTNPKALKSLVNATTHHKWQFVKFAKSKIRELLKKEEFRELFSTILNDLSDTDQNQLRLLLKE